MVATDSDIAELNARAQAIVEIEKDTYRQRTKASQAATERARKSLPLGVPSSFQAYDPHPVVAKRAQGSWMEDVDGNHYTDFNMGFGALFAVPIGILTGVYIVESGGTRLASAARFAADTLNGVPSIVIGLFAYALVVVPFRHFSALAGGFALGIMMIPLVTRTTEELLRLVPMSLREGRVRRLCPSTTLCWRASSNRPCRP